MRNMSGIIRLSLRRSEDLISCSSCKCLFHISCYNQSELTVLEDSSSSYKCIRCVHALNICKPITDFYWFIFIIYA